jgi:hypothetical protein
MAAAVITMDAIRRILGEFRPADWAILAVDLLVLIVIAIEFIHNLRREHREEQRRKEIVTRVRAVREALEKGHKLQHSAASSGDPRVETWYQSVLKWTEETRGLVRSFSPQAEACFADVSNPPALGNLGSVGRQFDYAQLLARLANLRSIIEKPDVYLM